MIKGKNSKKKERFYYNVHGGNGYYSLIFEGELLNGKKNGKGKEYDYMGNLIFEGEYLNGKAVNEKYESFYDNKELNFEEKVKLIIRLNL